MWRQNKAWKFMAEGYAIEEALGFCTKYLQDFTTTKQKVWDEKEE